MHSFKKTKQKKNAHIIYEMQAGMLQNAQFSLWFMVSFMVIQISFQKFTSKIYDLKMSSIWDMMPGNIGTV